MAGRKPLPDNLKKLRGTDQPCRLSPSPMEVARVDKAPPPPSWMSKTGKKIYRDASKDLMVNGLLQPISLPLFTAYCQTIATHIDAEIKMSKKGDDGRIVETKSGPKPSPWHRISMDALEKSRALAVEFGITPSAQSRIIANITQPKSREEIETEQFFD